MGDGGVACMPLQHHNNNNNNIIMEERFPVQPDNTTTTTPTTTTSSPAPAPALAPTVKANAKGSTNGVNPKTKKVMRKVIKVKKVVTIKKVVSADKKVVAEKRVVTAGKKEPKGSNSKEIENNKEVKSGSSAKEPGSAGSSDNKAGLLAGCDNGKEEVEEGELGTLKWPPKVEVENGEFVPPEKLVPRSEVERGEIVGEKWRKADVEKGEIVSGGKWRKGEFGRDEIEKGEFIPDRWHGKGDYGYGKPRYRYDVSTERTPPLLKYPPEDIYRRKEFNGSGSNQFSKSSSRWEIDLEKNLRISSKIVDEEGLYKSEYNSGKNQGREFSYGNRLKRYGTDSDSNENIKHYGDYGDYATSKSRRLSEDSARSSHPDHFSRYSIEKFYRNSSSRPSLPDKYSSRHHEPILSSKIVYERHGRSPAPSERSPRDRARYLDHKDRSPVRLERSPFVRERSPYGRERSPYGRERSPYGRERSPFGRERSPYVLEGSPYGRERSPYDRNRHFGQRNRSPAYSERSPQDRSRHYERKDRTPNYLERSPLDQSKPNISRETSRKSGASEKRSSQHGSKGEEDKLSQRDSNAKVLQTMKKESQDRSTVLDFNGSDEKATNCESQKEEHSRSPSVTCKPSPQVDGPPPEELISMEEDMDICDTPPHVPVVADSSSGKWVYLDYSGVECGPSQLCDLKALVEGGLLVSDHLIKHLDSDRWLTIEHAVSPAVPVNVPSIVSDTITQLVSPPESPGNVLVDTGFSELPDSQSCEEAPMLPALLHSDFGVSTSDSLVDLHIDERVVALMEGITIVPGEELETIGEVLQMTFEHAAWEELGRSEGLTWHQVCAGEQNDQAVAESSQCLEMNAEEAIECSATLMDSADWFSGRWSCKGGDWKRNDEVDQEKLPRRKIVLNDGFPLCQMTKSGSEDPRWHKKDELYYPSQSKRLDLPPWAFSGSDDVAAISRTSAVKAPIARGIKGTALPVVRINACVVTDHGSLISETRTKIRGRERYSTRSVRPYSVSIDVKRPSADSDIHSKAFIDQGLHSSWKSIRCISTRKDRLCAVDDLQLHLGEWYFLDGAGHEQGPSSFSELQIMADQGVIPKDSSVFRKFDRLWVPITFASETSESTVKTPRSNVASVDSSGVCTYTMNVSNDECHTSPSSFHSMHPQFIGYTRGKLQELVMKSYKSREFAAAINEVLDPWINAKQPKKEIDKQIYRKSESDARSGKRPRLQIDGSDDDCELEDDLQTVLKDVTTFEELCENAFFQTKESAFTEDEVASWGLLDGHTLARVFHFLRSDVKSLTFASLTCKHWRAASCFYKDISREVDLSSVGPGCSDSMIWKIMNGYNKDKINSMVLIGCTKITSGTLEEILHSFPCVSSIDIRGCTQFTELALQFPNVRWLKSRMRISEDSNAKLRNVKQKNDKTLTLYKSCGPANNTDDFSELEQYFDSVNKRDSANQLFRRSLYKRSKLFDARRSSSIVSRDARTRRWAIKKSENGYKRMQGFLVSGLKDIMKENTFDFFIPKVAEIENRMRRGYYIGHGLRSVKEDIGRMCQDAIKAKNRGGGDMNHIITLFLQLASRLDESSKFSYERDELMKAWKDDLSIAGGSASMKSRKKHGNEKKHMHRGNGSSLANGSSDYGDCVSDREIRKRLSKLNRKSLDSGSDTSNDMDRSSEDGRSANSSNASDTESDLELRSECRNAESRVRYILDDDGYDCMTDEREWGARMTKASLVPPVTRKYEVIDEYVIVADEEDVRRKMSVSLPDDYAEKLDAQRAEESDMELPEVKGYKPRKQLGIEVIEQEVYGIDPYTHNLLLDSMPEAVDWPLLEKHLFIEEVLLCTLNKQARHFTGCGNTPMKYSLKPVIEEIELAAAKGCDIRTTKMCQGIMKAINGRPDDNYVAYRKGLGVVCNKEGGFTKEDFVVQFLGEVYPAWKWFEKQDGIRFLQKNSNDPAPEFYNIYLERPKGDADGYDLVVVDAMHKANYASRICHSCRPNCEAKVTAVDGHYQIGIYTVREIQYGEEITFDYNSVTESKEEYEASVCLCGSQVCRGSYLNLTGEGAFQKVLKEWHGVVDRYHLMLEACELNSVCEEDYLDLGRAGLGSCLLGALPDWVVAYSARLVRFINLERTKLPEEILRHNLEEKRKYFSDICLEVERSDAEVQAEGVYNQRLQNLAVTLDKVRYVMRCVFGDAKKAPPPLKKLSPEETVSFLWKGEGSLVEELLKSLSPHVEADTLNDITSKIRAQDPSNSNDIQKGLQKSLLWLRDEIRSLPCTYKCYHDATADLIHIYAYTKNFFRLQGYDTYTSPPVHISPLDLSANLAAKLGPGMHEYRKKYDENYCMGQLLFWHIQTNGDPDCSLAKASRGCLSLPDMGSFYTKVQKPSQQRIYGPKTVKMMLERMEKYLQKPWPKDQIWSFKSDAKVFGSPMLDSVINNDPLDRDMLYWLKHRPAIFQASWDR